MVSQNLMQLLKNTGLVSGETAASIAEHFIPIKIPAGQFLLKEGKISNEYLFLESGFMRGFCPRYGKQ
jgi:hypothetical protein